jgi:hypothetical protein
MAGERWARPSCSAMTGSIRYASTIRAGSATGSLNLTPPDQTRTNRLNLEPRLPPLTGRTEHQSCRARTLGSQEAITVLLLHIDRVCSGFEVRV